MGLTYTGMFFFPVVIFFYLFIGDLQLWENKADNANMLKISNSCGHGLGPQVQSGEFSCCESKTPAFLVNSCISSLPSLILTGSHTQSTTDSSF